jgi:serine protease Do
VPKRHRRFWALLAAAALAGPAALTIATAPSARADLRDLLPFGRAHRIAELLPLVVAINTHIPAADKDGGSELRESFGSGFIIDSSGFIATNRHVIANALDITVTLQDGTAMPAKLVGTGSHIDLALLKVEPRKPLPVIKWGDSSHVRVGDQVLVIGDPLAVGETVSSGIVSAVNRDIQIGPYDDFIQTDAAINHGNSGGPMFNLHGEVIGVNTALVSATGGSVGLGFSIPSNDAQYVLKQLRQFGRTKPGWLGADTQEMAPDIADALGFPLPHGTIIANLDKDGPAAKADLRDGDVILKFGAQTPKDMRALSRMVEQATGETVPLLVWRDGQQMTVPVVITEWVEPPPPTEDGKQGVAAAGTMTQPPDLGLHTAPLTDEARASRDLVPGQPGVLLTGTAPGTPAAGHGLKEGDVILRVQKTAVAAPEEVQKQIDEARKQKLHHVVLLVQGTDGVRWVALSLG